jgi:membrane protein implicated in regulation of membrane protease activity
VCVDGHRARALVKPDLRLDRVATVFAILAYAPLLLCLPVLLLIGVVFVVVPGGCIVVLAGFYYLAAGFTSLLGLEVTRRWRGRRSRVRRTSPRFENVSSSRSSSGRRGTIAPKPIAVGFTNERAVGSAANVLLSRRGSDDVDLVAPLERGRVAGGQDGARAV